MSAPFHFPSAALPTRNLPDISSVWRASELSAERLHTLDTGYADLNRELPGGGWPQGALIEILQPQSGQHEWGLLAPALAALQAAKCTTQNAKTLLVLTGTPYLPFGPALGARQLAMHRVLSVHTEAGNAPSLLWATREALQCADVAAVLAWLPDARSAHLRRLQIAAHTHHKLLFVFRPLRAQHESSPAPLRLLLEGYTKVQDENGEGADVQVQILKRRGPPLAAPLHLATRPDRLSALLQASRERVRRRRHDDAAAVPAVIAPPSAVDSPPLSHQTHHALDRTASLHH
ncbi:MAG: translesion DNA synthesis-associated protein ImuA [Polaromonas sp.]|nr:translesion DNA synthesis-associated protein ImuA [Polaromonas sp.]